MRLPIPKRLQPFVLEGLLVPKALLSGLRSEAVEVGFGDGLVRVDLGVSRGRICQAEELPEAIRIPTRGWAAMPRLVEAHVHLDKTDTVSMTGMGVGTLSGAIGTLGPAMRRWGASHFRTRMTRAVEEAIVAGTGVIRSHVDCVGLPAETPAWQALLDVAQDFSDQIRIQPVALAALDRALEAEFGARCRQVAEAGGVLGAFIPPERVASETLDAFLMGAGQHGLDVDLHVDEHLSDVPSATVAVAEAVLRTGYEGRVLAGHACRLALMSEAELDGAVDVIARSGIAVAALPRTNLFLQDRGAARTPLRRGTAPVRELAARGVPIVIGTDNVRDAFFPFGNYDLLSLFAEAACCLHLEQDLGGWIRSVSKTPAGILGFEGAGAIAAGFPADLVLVQAQNWSEILTSRPESRVILIGGEDAAAGQACAHLPKEIAI